MKRILVIFLVFIALTVNDINAQRKIGINNSAHFSMPRLSPQPTTVSGVQAAVISLNGQWDFSSGISNPSRKSIEVPGEWELQGYSVNEGEVAVYERRLDVPVDWTGKRIKLRFDAVSSHAVILVNGRIAGEHEGGFVPFEMDITDFLVKGRNTLQVRVQALTVSDRLASTSQYAVHTVGGLLRKVRLFVLPGLNIAAQNVGTYFDAAYRNATLKVTSTIANEMNLKGRVQLRYTLRNAEQMIAFQKTYTASSNKNNQYSIIVKGAEKWNPEHPYLYALTTELLLNGKVIQTNNQRVGFRQIEIKGNLMLVNGIPVKLRGVNRHSIYPLTGRSITPELDWKDVRLFRDANCNFIRTSHYPPSEDFLEAADELGLFVESEAALCWINHGAAPIWRKWNYLDGKFLPYMIRANVENIMAGRNHPSVIIWSLGNESLWSPLWEKVLSVVKKLDPTRPTTFHDQCWGGYNNGGSKADIAVFHYPGMDDMKKCDTMSRPVLMGEYAHVSCYNRRELLTDPGIRAAYGKPLARLYDSMYYHKGCLGGAIWSGIDDIFHLPDGRILGYGPWGLIDAWRRPKPEYIGMKRAYAPIIISNVDKPDFVNGILRLKVENRYDFTSLNEVKIICKADGRDIEVKSELSPGSTGWLEIPVGMDTKEIYISFVDPRGFVAIEEKIRLKAKKGAPLDSTVQVTLSENDAIYTVTQGTVKYLISKTTGIILSAYKGDEKVLSQGPVFGIVPMNKDDGGKPTVASESYQNNIYPLKDYPLYTLFAKNITVQSGKDGVHMNMDVIYSNGSGRQSYHFTTDGKLITKYEVKYNGKDTLPYQYGLIMQLPSSFERLRWKRKGAYSIYPDDDIARNEGTALLKAKHVNGVEEYGVIPETAWKDDANDLGSNDFRSTKRQIYSATLSDNAGNTIAAFSSGVQFSRSWLQDERINWLIGDYCNNGSEPFYGTPFINGRDNIKNKTLTGSAIISIK